MTERSGCSMCVFVQVCVCVCVEREKEMVCVHMFVSTSPPAVGSEEGERRGEGG